MAEVKKGYNGVRDMSWRDKLPRAIYATLERVPTSQGWFEVYRLPHDVYAFYEDGQYEETLCFLVLGKERAVLVDTGDGIADVKAMARELTALPLSVVNTHSHIDHVAHNCLFDDVAAFDDDQGIARATALNGYTVERASQLIAPGNVWKDYPAGFDPSTYRVRPYQVTHWLRDGEIVDLGGRQLEVVHTPGHSPDSICLLDRANRMLFVGDTFYAGGIYTYLPGGDLAQMKESYKKLLAMGDLYDVILPSHNEPLGTKDDLVQVLDGIGKIEGGMLEPLILPGGFKKYVFPRFSLVMK